MEREHDFTAYFITRKLFSVSYKKENIKQDTGFMKRMWHRISKLQGALTYKMYNPNVKAPSNLFIK